MNWKKLLGTLLLVVALLLAMGATAMAEEITAVPEDKIGYITPMGMEDALTINKQDGSLTIAIDDSEVDWAKAFASSGGEGNAQIIWQIKAPENAQYVRMLQDPEDGSDVLAVLESSRLYYFNLMSGVPCEPSGMPITEKGQTIATGILDMDYVVPQDVNTVIYVRWYDNAQTILSTQKLNVSITHTQKQAFTAKTFIGAAAERIIPDTASDVTLLQQKDGAVTYYVPAPGTDTKTLVKAPAGATQYKVYGNMKSAPSDVQPLVDGRYAEATVTSSGNVFTSTQIVCFFDGSDNLLETVTVSIIIQPEEELKVWPAYYDLGVFPLSADQLDITNDAASMGYIYTYDENTGHMTCSFNGKQITGETMKNNMTLRFRVPEWGAESYRIYQIGSNGLLGSNGGSLEKMQLELDNGYPNGPEAITDPSLVYQDSYKPFRVIKPGADPSITLYVPDPSAMVNNFVQLYVIEWTCEDGTNEYQYLYLTTEPFTASQQTYAVSSSVSQLSGPVTRPTVVMEGGSGLQLLVTYYITEGDSAWHVELTLVDQQGNAVQPDGPVQVYLPFPEGHQSGDSYILHHYTNGLYDESALYNYNALNIQETGYGLMFETDSFSPFIYSRVSEDTPVTPDASPVQPPKTGDDAPLTLWLSLVLLSAAAALLLWRSRKTA